MVKIKQIQTLKFVITLLTLLACQNVYALTSITATVDQNPATVDESLVLTVIADDNVSADEYDPSFLSEYFHIGNTSVRSQSSMVNFETTRSTIWTTVITPKKKGTAIIPAITFDNVSSKPIRLEVLDRDDSRASVQKDVYITSEVSKTEVYVQQQFTLKVKLHFSAELSRASLYEPKMTGAEIKQIGQDTENLEIINGKRVQTIERIYSIKPESSGKFVLHSSLFDGEIIQSQRRRLISGFGRGKPVRIQGKQIDIIVKPKPESFQGDWLPSEIIEIQDTWPDEIEEFELGEPITRQIAITAAALSEEQLPEIEFSTPQHIRIYPDQSESKMGVRNGVLISQKIQDFAIVPAKPGTYTLAEVKIPWWNTTINRLEYAIIPSKTFTVNASNSTVATTTNAPLQKQVIVEQSTTLQWFFLAGWILTALSWLYVARFKGKFTNNKQLFSSEDKQSYLQLLAACNQGDGEKVLKLLPLWAKDLFANREFHNLTQVEQVLADAEFSTELQLLQRNYFSATAINHWDGKKMLKIISRLQTKKSQAQQVEFLLNPN